jgi:hypothetical protein
VTEPGLQSSGPSGPRPAEGVEPDRPRTGRLFALIGLFLLVVAVVVVGLWVFFVQATTGEIHRKELSLLSKEMAEVRARDQGRLTQYDLIDPKLQHYQIPIRRAIEHLLENPALITPVQLPAAAAKPAASTPASTPAERPR